jgi:hypothetical protein
MERKGLGQGKGKVMGKGKGGWGTGRERKSDVVISGNQGLIRNRYHASSMLDGSLVIAAWRVFSLRLEKKVFRYGG